MKKMFFALLLAALLLIGLPAAAQDSEPVTLRITNWSAEQQELYDDATAEFEQEYPNINVEWETLAQQQYRETLPLRFQSDDAPDIFFWIGANRVLTMQELLDLGWIAPISPADGIPNEWFERWPENSFIEGLNVIGDDVYSFPFNDNKIWGAGYMYMNRSVFEAAGLDVEAPPETWSELTAACQQIVESGAAAYCLSFPLAGTDFQRPWYALSGSIMGDTFFDYQTGRYAIDDPRKLQAFDYIKSLYDENLVIPGVNDSAFARAAIANSQAGIYFDGAWMPGVFRNSFDFTDVAVARAPFPDEGPRGTLAQTFSENKFYVSSQSEHPEEAWLFLEWMTRPDGFFATEYIARGFGTLGYVDNVALISDSTFAEVAEIGMAEDFRVLYPEPVLACPDVANSGAMQAAENLRRNWEFEAMVEALTTGSDFAATAAEIAAAKNEIFLETLEAEQEAGLDVSVECFTFADWSGTENFGVEMYDTSGE